MNKTIYLHIGTPKTASTFLQSALAKNSDVLRSQGVLYPSSGRYSGQDKHLHLHHNVAQKWSVAYSPKQRHRLRKTGAVGKNQLHQLRRDLLSEIQQFDGNTVVVSCENFWKLRGRQIRLLRRIFADYDVRVLAYLRRQDKFLESRSTNLTLVENLDSYKQRVMDPASSHRRDCNYSKILNTWASKFGKENIKVRVFEKQQLQGASIIDDFLHVIGVARTDDFTEPNESNVSLVRDGLEIKSVLNGLLMDSEQPNPLSSVKDYIPEIIEYTRANGLPKYSIFTDTERQWLLEEYAPTNGRVAKCDMNRERDVLFSSPP